MKTKEKIEKMEAEIEQIKATLLKSKLVKEHRAVSFVMDPSPVMFSPPSTTYAIHETNA